MKKNMVPTEVGEVSWGVLVFHRLKSMVMRALAVSAYQIDKDEVAHITPFFKTGITNTNQTSPDHFSGHTIKYNLPEVI